MNFAEKLLFAQQRQNSWVCVGLDPDLTKIPEFIVNKYGMDRLPDLDGPLEIFNKEIIKATAPYVCAYKPNLAFYEVLGQYGWLALQRTVEFIKKNYPNHIVIIDGKRGDIGNTAAMYAEMYKELGADAGTVNPYLGSETLEPFFKQDLGVIAICKTSNPGSADFQNLVVTSSSNHLPFYLRIAEKLNFKFAATGNLGLVVGATYPQELASVRDVVGLEIPILIPGIGKQGGDLEATLKSNNNGLAIINSSREIIYASNGQDFADAAGRAAMRLRDQINTIQEKPTP